jgi:hypothetical protein
MEVFSYDVQEKFNLLVEKVNYLRSEKIIAYDSEKKFGLIKRIEQLEKSIEEYKKIDFSDLEDQEASDLVYRNICRDIGESESINAQYNFHYNKYQISITSLGTAFILIVIVCGLTYLLLERTTIVGEKASFYLLFTLPIEFIVITVAVLIWDYKKHTTTTPKSKGYIPTHVFVPVKWKKILFQFIPFLDFKKSYLNILERNGFTRDRLKEIFKDYVLPSKFDFDKEGLTRLFSNIGIKKANDITKNKKEFLFSLFENGFFKEESKNEPTVVLVLADSGIGKTTFLQQLFIRQAKKYSFNQLAFVYCGENTDEEIANIPNKHNTILFLDGLDEDDKARKNLKLRLDILSDLLMNFDKVVVSCRTQFFEDTEAEWNQINKNLETYCVELKNFEEYEALSYVNKKYKRDRKKRTEATHFLKRNSSFFCRPLLLMYIDSFVSDPDNKLRSYTYLYQIYETIIVKWSIRNKKSVTNQKQKITYDELVIRFSKQLAIYLYEQETKGKEIDIQNEFLENQTEIENKIDAQSRSFLARTRQKEKNDVDSWHFSHQSFYDYFLALLLFEQQIREENPIDGKPNIIFEKEQVSSFYNEMLWHKVCRHSLKNENDNLEQISKHAPTPTFQNKFLIANCIFFKKELEKLDNSEYDFKKLEFFKQRGIEHYFITDFYSICQSSILSGTPPETPIFFVNHFIKEIYSLLDTELKLEGKYKDIWEMSSTGYFSVFQHELSKIPSEVGYLKRVHELALHWNEISVLPYTLENLNNLKDLDISYNKLNHFFFKIEKLLNLESLDFGSNKFEKIPTEVFKLTNLTNLEANYNRISEIPKEIENLKNLRSFHLDGNHLKELPKSIGNCIKLSFLHLNKNHLKELPESIGNCIKLSSLHLENNNFSKLPFAIHKLTNKRYHGCFHMR